MSDNPKVVSRSGSEKNDGHVLTGCWFGCLIQAIFIVVGLGAASIVPSNNGLWVCSWGLTQWIGLVPLILNQRASGYPNTARGVFITGCIGFLLASACAGFATNIFKI